MTSSAGLLRGTGTMSFRSQSAAYVLEIDWRSVTHAALTARCGAWEERYLVSYFANVADALASAPDPDRNGSGAHGWKALGTGNGTAFEWSVLR
jgi:hypothetical protein